MATSARKTISNAVVWVILLLLIVGLAGFGAVSFSGTVRSIGKVGDTPVPVARYARGLSQDLRNFQQQLGQPLSFQQAQLFGIDQAALGRLVGQVALENEAARIGLSVGDEDVRRQLLQIQDFQGFDGSFDDRAYRELLRRQGQSVEEFEDGLRAESARVLLQASIGGGVQMPEPFSETVFQWAGERRNFQWAPLTAEHLTTPVAAPTEADLKAFHDANPGLFTEPESRDITYALLTPEMLVPKVTVDEDALKKLYAEKADTYNQPERRLVERLVFANTDEAQAAWDRLQSGDATFEALVAERGLTLDDIDMGDVTPEALGDAAPAVFALTEPGLVGPVETDLGPAIIRMNGILSAESTSYEQARPDLLAEYATDRASRMINDMVENIDDLLAGGATIEDLAKETDMTVGQINWRDGSDEGPAAYPAFRTAAAAVTKDDYPQVIPLDEGGIFALRLNAVVPPRLQPLDEVRGAVAAAWTQAETTRALMTLAGELASRVAAGEDPAAFGLVVNFEDATTRDGFVAEAPANLIGKVFEMDKGEAAGLEGADGGVVLVYLTDILPPDPANAELAAARDQYRNQLSQALASDLVTAFMRAVQAQAGIQLDQAAINAVNAQFQ